MGALIDYESCCGNQFSPATVKDADLDRLFSRCLLVICGHNLRLFSICIIDLSYFYGCFRSLLACTRVSPIVVSREIRPRASPKINIFFPLSVYERSNRYDCVESNTDLILVMSEPTSNQEQERPTP